MIQEFCPNGVEYKKLEDVAVIGDNALYGYTDVTRIMEPPNDKTELNSWASEK